MMTRHSWMSTLVITLVVMTIKTVQSMQQCSSSGASVQVINRTAPLEPEILDGYLSLGFSPERTVLLIRESYNNPRVDSTILYQFDIDLNPTATLNLSIAQPSGATAVTGDFTSATLYAVGPTTAIVDLASNTVLGVSSDRLPIIWEPLYAWLEQDGSMLYSSLTGRNDFQGSGVVSINPRTLAISSVSQLSLNNEIIQPLFIGPCLASSNATISYCVTLPNNVSQAPSLNRIKTGTWEIELQVTTNVANYMVVASTNDDSPSVFIFGNAGPLTINPEAPMLVAYDRDLNVRWALPLGRGLAAGLVSNSQLVNGTLLIASTLEFFGQPTQQQTFWAIDGRIGRILACWDLTASLGRHAAMLLFGSGTPAPVFFDSLSTTISLTGLMLNPHEGQNDPEIARFTAKLFH